MMFSIACRRVALPAVLAAGLMTWGTRASAQSLYREDTYRALAADRKAHRVGDVITVQVFEQSSATSQTDTTTQRNNSLNAALTILPPGPKRAGSLDLDVGGSFDGGGSTQRANRVLAVLSVNVTEVLPNGDLKVAGAQLLTINNEQHKVSLEGRLRPQDISSDNVVLSTRLADAKIDYLGKGDLSSRQRPSWWRRFMDAVGF